MVRAAGLSTRWTTLGPYLLTSVMSFPPPSFGGQAPLPASEGGAEPSGKEASPVRSAHKCAVESQLRMVRPV